MNCKPGDLAIVVADDSSCAPGCIGAIVEVLHFAIVDPNDGPMWMVRTCGQPVGYEIVDEGTRRPTGEVEYDTECEMADKCLRPLPGATTTDTEFATAMVRDLDRIAVPRRERVQA